MRRISLVLVMVSFLLSAGCAMNPKDPTGNQKPTTGKRQRQVVLSTGDASRTMTALAEDYVKLVLALGERDPGYVDAYYGPEEWKKSVESKKPTLSEIRSEAERLSAALEPVAVDPSDELLSLRRTYLLAQLSALLARVGMLEGKRLSFDEESRALYDATAPRNPESHFQETLEQLERELPGSGTLLERYDRFRNGYVIPREKLDVVFRTAIDECRKRTARHIALPPEESFTVEYVTGKSWSGYNWYQGNFRSLIQVNTDLPVYIDRAVDLACHEGYPGHHVYNVLLEKHSSAIAAGRK